MKNIIAPKNNPRRLTYKDKKVYLKENPRTGYCSNPNCSNKGKKLAKTHIHHDKYHDDDPTKDTRELCDHCHKLEPMSWKEEEALKAVAEMFGDDLL